MYARWQNDAARNPPMDDLQLEELFRAWWADSYSMPPGPHVLMTHLSWARYLLSLSNQKTNQQSND